MKAKVPLDGDETGRQALPPPGRRPKQQAKSAGRFPVFAVPKDARMIPAARIQDALDEEDRLSGGHSEPLATIESKPPRLIGQDDGLFEVPDDFDAPLPDDQFAACEVEQIKA